MSLIENLDDDGYYMPHHVIKDSSNTTKIQVVFDASTKSNNGVSLNDTDDRPYYSRQIIFTSVPQVRHYRRY